MALQTARVPFTFTRREISHLVATTVASRAPFDYTGRVSPLFKNAVAYQAVRVFFARLFIEGQVCAYAVVFRLTCGLLITSRTGVMRQWGRRSEGVV